MYYFIDNGDEHIPANSPKAVSLETFFTELDKLPYTYEDNFIGLINEQEETIQFIRFEDDGWLLDVPIIKDGIYSHSLQDSDLSTFQVREIVKKFFEGKHWMALCNLKRV